MTRESEFNTDWDGAQSVLPPTTEPWGQCTCYIAGPVGNLMEIGSFFQKTLDTLAS